MRAVVVRALLLVLAGTFGAARGASPAAPKWSAPLQAMKAACLKPSTPNAPPAADGSAGLCSVPDVAACVANSPPGPVVVAGRSPLLDVWVSPNATRFSAGYPVNVSCVSITAMDIRGGDTNGHVMSAPLVLEPPANSTLTLEDVYISTSCAALNRLQTALCSSRPSGRVYVWQDLAYFEYWKGADVLYRRVAFVCPEQELVEDAPCTIATVDSVEDIRQAASSLQSVDVPLVLALPGNLNFTGPEWPASGLPIYSSVTLTALSLSGSETVLDFGLKTPLFVVDSGSENNATLMFRGFIMLNLPLVYLPLAHPRRPFGVLAASMWPVYRMTVAMRLKNCTLVLQQEEFQFWAHWLTILSSKIPSVRQQGNWSTASNVTVEPSGDDFIHLSTYKTRYSAFDNVRYLVTDKYPQSQRNNILQITGDAQVPPTAVIQVKDDQDLTAAVVGNLPAIDNNNARGQFIVFTSNISINATAWPDEGYLLDSVTTFTAWPQTYAIFDLRRHVAAFEVMVSLALKNLVLLNLPSNASSGGYMWLESGLWAFNVSDWEASQQQQQIALERVILVVQQSEVALYKAATSNRSCFSSGLLADWIVSCKVHSYDTVNGSWIYYTDLTTLRFEAKQINITSSQPNLFDVVPVDRAPNSGTEQLAPQGDAAAARQRFIMYLCLAILLPSAVTASIMTYLWIRRQRYSRACSKMAAHLDTVNSKDGSTASTDGAQRPEVEVAQPTCCWLRTLLPDDKYVNPLYVERGQRMPAVELELVLGVRHPADRPQPRQQQLLEEEQPQPERQEQQVPLGAAAVQAAAASGPRGTVAGSTAGSTAASVASARRGQAPGGVAEQAVLPIEDGAEAALQPLQRLPLQLDAVAELQKMQQVKRDIGDKQLEVQHSLGWGGCGVVYKGTWKGLPVAVKTVLIQSDNHLSHQYLMEAAISASLHHINIVTTYQYELKALDEVDTAANSGSLEIAVASDDGRPRPLHGGRLLDCWRLYIVQEFCDQGTLKAAIDQGYFRTAGAVDMVSVLAVAIDVVSGLTHIHAKNVLHGDLTVSNVLLQSAPSLPRGYIAKLADFGLSIKMEQGQSHLSDVYRGTPHYMAPEVQLRGHISKAADMYALGVVLWEMYCGTPPWRSSVAARHQGRNAQYGEHHQQSRGGLPPRRRNSRDFSGSHGSGGSAEHAAALEPFSFPRGCPDPYACVATACLSEDPAARPLAMEVLEQLRMLLNNLRFR